MHNTSVDSYMRKGGGILRFPPLRPISAELRGHCHMKRQVRPKRGSDNIVVRMERILAQFWNL